MRRFCSKRGSTLVMALFLLAFVILVGTSMMLLATASVHQSTKTLTRQQADFTAKSVLDSVISKILSGELSLEPLYAGGAPSLTGNGTDAVLGAYDIRIEPHPPVDSRPSFKVTVTSDYNGGKSEVYSVLSGYGSTPGKRAKFETIALSTGYGQVGTTMSNAHIYGSASINNRGETMVLMVLAGSGSVRGSVEIDGGLDIGGSFVGGVAGQDNVFSATEAITMGGSAVLYADVNSEKAVTVGGSGQILGSVSANGNITLNGSATAIGGSVTGKGNIDLSGGTSIQGGVRAEGNVTTTGSSYIRGDLYTNGNVTMGGSTRVQGDVYAMGNVTMDGSARVEGKLYALGDVTLTGSAAVWGGIYTEKSISLTNHSRAIELVAGENIELSNCSNITSIEVGGNVYIHNSTMTLDITTPGSVYIGKRINGNVSKSTITGAITAGGVIELHNSTVIGPLTAGGNILLTGTDTLLRGDAVTNGNFTGSGNSPRFEGNIWASGDFTVGRNSTGNVYIGGNASLINVLLTGNLTAAGNGVFRHTGNNKNVSGVITLGGTLDPSSTTRNTVVFVNPATLEPVPTIDPVEEPEIEDDMVPPVTLPPVKVEPQTDASDWYIPASIRAEMAATQIDVNLSSTSSPHYTIQNSGRDHIINRSCTLTIRSFSWDKRVILDATAGDLYILLKAYGGGSTVSFTDGFKLLTRGDHNVFVLLDDGTGNYVDLNVAGNSFLGYEGYLGGVPSPDPRIPNLFIINNAQGTPSKRPKIDMNSYSTLYGFIYAPYATVDLRGSTLHASKLYGGVTASVTYMASSMNYRHYIPDLPDDPDDPGGGGPPSGEELTWVVHGTYLN